MDSGATPMRPILIAPEHISTKPSWLFAQRTMSWLSHPFRLRIRSSSQMMKGLLLPRNWHMRRSL